MSFGMTSYPLIRYVCSDCGKDLGTNFDRAKKKKVPNANHIDGKCFCDKCENKYFEKKEAEKNSAQCLFLGRSGFV